MKKAMKVVGLLVVGVVVIAAGVLAWATVASNRLLARTFEVHTAAFPIPFPLTTAELAEAGVAADEDREIASERAIERGRHLVEARYACVECHGRDFSGGVMVDAFPIGRLLGPNLTRGIGSRTLTYTPADWDRIVRHGLRPDGTPAAMPSEDFQLMSDQELSDIVAYLQSQPPVDNEVPPVSFGPLGKVLLATGQLPLSVDLIGTEDNDHVAYPPSTEVSVDFGRHLAGICSGCHRKDLAGGPIAGGDPSWVPARNLTPHADGMGGWTYEQFVTAMTESRRPDGTALRPPMTFIQQYAQQMTDVEMEALWLYLQSVPPVAGSGI